MKTKILIQLLITAGMALCFTNSVNAQEKGKVKKVNRIQDSSLLIGRSLVTLIDYSDFLPGENPISPVSAIPVATATNIIEMVPNYLKINGKPLRLLAAEINTLAMKSFEDLANSIPVANTCTNTIASLEIMYGATTLSTLVLYYRPVLFCATVDKYGQGGQRFGHYSKQCDLNKYYSYSPGTDKFDEIINATDLKNAKDDIARYMDNTKGIQINRTGNVSDPFTPFIPGTTDTDINGDVKSLVFPFQEITETKKDLNTIRLWNAMEKMQLMGTPTPDLLYKHIVVLSSNNVTATVTDGIEHIALPIDPSFANLSHICPPSCNGDEFTFVRGTKR